MNNPRISILLAIFNSEKFISETIESVLTQSYLDWELLIEDGGSQDRTIEIVEKYAAKCPNIKVVSERDEGQGHALWKAAQRARGELVMILAASDGYLSKEWLSLCVEEMDKDTEVSVVWGIPFTMRSNMVIGPHFAYAHFFKNQTAQRSFIKRFAGHLRHPVALFKKMNFSRLRAAKSALRQTDVPQKEAWFDYWLNTGLIFPDGNMCIARKAYFDCMPAYHAGTKEQVDWMKFFFNLNSKGYLAYCIPIPANFARDDHEGQLGQKIIAFTERNRNDYYDALKDYRKDILRGTASITFVDRDGNRL